jgi:HEAT repeat protein
MSQRIERAPVIRLRCENRILNHTMSVLEKSMKSITPPLSMLAVGTMLLVLGMPPVVAQQRRDSATEEKRLLAVLQSDAPAAQKAISCKELAVYGSSDAVPELAKLLPNPQLSSWARIALEVIPGDPSDAALRTAAEAIQGQLLVGVINSIGVRRDAKAVPILIDRLNDDDLEVASAAAVALGRIADNDATEALQTALGTVPGELRSSVAEACVLCAEARLLSGRQKEAADIYDQVRSAEVPLQRIVEATRGSILARGQDGVPLLVQSLRSPEKKLRQLALATVREFPGDQIDAALANELKEVSPARAVSIIQAMADRPQTVVLPAILAAVENGNPQVKASAIDSLRRVGDESCLEILLSVATSDDAELQQIAKSTLAELPGEGVNAKIVTMLAASKGKQYPVLLHLVAQRRVDAVPQVVQALNHQDPVIRHSALIALGQTVSLDRLSLLIDAVVQSQKAEDAEVASQALRAASVRMPDREACAAQLSKAIPAATSGTKTTLLEILAEMGGENALAQVSAAAMSRDPQLQDDGSRLLGKWNSVAAAPSLMNLAVSGPSSKYQVRGMRGYIGVARKFPMPETQRVEMCRQAFEKAARIDEQKLVLDVLKIHPSAEGLALAIQAQKVAAIKTDATVAASQIAQKLGGKGVDIASIMNAGGMKPVKLQIVQAEYGADGVGKDVTAVVQKNAGSLAWINLSERGYNAAFGGDPVPGKVKKLTIKYVMDGKQGTASFDENAPILLPQPK